MTCSLCKKEMKMIEDFGEGEKVWRCDKCQFEALERDGNMVKWNRYGKIIKEKKDETICIQ